MCYNQADTCSDGFRTNVSRQCQTGDDSPNCGCPPSQQQPDVIPGFRSDTGANSSRNAATSATVGMADFRLRSRYSFDATHFSAFGPALRISEDSTKIMPLRLAVALKTLVLLSGKQLSKLRNARFPEFV